MLRRAFSMIELVITIVVIGIVAASFPLILTQTGNSLAVAIQQEAILSAKTYIGIILSYPWDGNAVDNINGSYKLAIVETSDGDEELKNSRQGLVAGEERRSYGAVPLSAIGEVVGRTSIDNFDGETEDLTVVDTNNMDSILRLTLTPQVYYVLDEAEYGGTELDFVFENNSTGEKTNIKSIVLTANNTDSSDPTVNIVLRAYMSNIGETGINGKDW